jgi:outer membrane autotransporter protein
VQFNSGVIVHPGTTLSFDGQVEIEIEITVDSLANFSQSPDSVMQFDLGQSIDDSFLDLTGSLTIEPLVSGDPDDLVTTVIVNYEGNIIAGDYTLIRATEGITGEFDVEEFPTSSIFDFSAEFNPDGGSGHIYLLTVEQIAFYNDFAESSNQTGVAQYLEDARTGAAVTSFADIITQFDAISDPSQRTTALAQLNPGSFDAHTSGILSWGRVQQRELQQRPMRCERFQFAPMPDVVTDDPCGAGGLMPWTKVVGSLGKNKGGSEPGYDSLVGGAIIGVDYKWNESLWLSGSMGYGTGEIEHDVGADGSFKSIDVGIAAGTVRGALSVRGSFTYSHGFHDVAREIDFLGARLESQFDSDRVGLALGAGYRLKLGLILIEPNVTIDYSHVVEEAVTEEGTAEVALNLKARTTDLFSGAAGVQFSTNILKYRYFGEMLEWADGLWIPSFSFKWRQAFGDVDRNATARMQGVSAAGGSFNSKASDSSGGVEIGAHLSFQPMKSGNTIELGYDGFFGGDVTTHSAKVTVRIPF